MKRRAVSTVVAEIWLIVVTLIAVVFVGSFFFTSLGNSSKQAQITVSGAVCSEGASDNTICSLSLTNLGTKNAQIAGSSYLTFGGHSDTEDLQGSCVGGGQTLKAGSTVTVTCSFNLASGGAGQQFTGWVQLYNGDWVPFVGTFGASGQGQDLSPP
jgi:Archaeal Type IV pilin, N-terminal